MIQSLQDILSSIQQSDLSDAEKVALEKIVMQADKEYEIVKFKLDRTEKVKKTTSILLEETIEELERKRKAVEIQNRELEIESALERVRTSAMAMNKPEDMLTVCRVIYQQLEFLGVKNIRNAQTIILNDPLERYTNYEYFNLYDKEIIIEVNYDAHPIIVDFIKQIRSSDDYFFHLKIEGDTLDDWRQYLKTGQEKVDPRLDSATAMYYYMYSIGPGALGVSTYDTPMPDEDVVVLKRFRNVFQLAYRRYLDIEQAVTQHREAQIQLGLERVRARTMAMQRSDELTEASAELYRQLTILGEPAHQLTIGIIKEAEGVVEVSVTLHGNKFPQTIRHPISEPYLMQKMYDAWKAGKKTFILELRGEELIAYNQFRNNLVGENLFPVNLSPDSRRIITFANFSKGTLAVATDEPRPAESLQLLERFAAVFELTYTRFLDLLRSEEQTREARIELALERVRARTMAMQHSEEMVEASHVLFNELQMLGIHAIRTGVATVDERNETVTVWSSQLVDKNDIKILGVVPRKAHPFFDGYLKAWKKKEPYFSFRMIGDEVRSYYMKMSSILSYPLQSEFNPTETFQVFFFPEGSLNVITHEPLSEESCQLLVRFARVFGLIYRRFLDLKQAEAQAREAQIEASLERVRSKAMAMHQSEDLVRAVSTVFEELDKLSIGLLRSGIGILNPADMRAEVWMTVKTESGMSAPVSGDESMDTHPLLRAAYQGWLHHEDVSYTLEGDDIRAYYSAISGENIPIPDWQKSGEISMDVKQYYHCSMFQSGGLFAFSNQPFSNEAKSVLKRFADVFNLTYTRFLDLQKAEAQAKESQIEASLERVRSRTLAMQKSDELAETAAVLFRQLISLGIQPNRLYITIIKNEHEAEFWITDEDGSRVSTAFHTNMLVNPTFKKMLDGWKSEKKTLIIDMQGKELEDYFKHLNSINVPFKGGLTQTRRVQHIAYFSKGFIGMASPEEQPAETMQLLERFASVFNLTFTRFNDLIIAEQHARQAEQDLQNLITEKKRTEEALNELRTTQAQLIQAEKMASLGELTAGIAHEIQNPLNFVNNFSEVNSELIEELKDELAKGNIQSINELASIIKENEEKIVFHGKRADGIVKSMLLHSRTGSGQKELTDLNVMVDEYLRLAYHGMRAKDKSFNVDFKTELDPELPKINVMPQDIGRVLLNLINNAFQALSSPYPPEGGHKRIPTVIVGTKQVPPPGGRGQSLVEISISDNGPGIPDFIKEKIFQPFFTTKPAGQGTGLGLSLSYDIIKAHGGELKVETKQGEGSTFIITLPIN